MDIAPFRFEHVEAVVELELEVFQDQDPWSRNAFINELKAPQGLWRVTVDDTRVVAYGGGWVIGREFHVLNFAVAPDLRRGGLGRDLLTSVLEAATERGCREALLDVRENNASARRLYEKIGFVVEGVRRRYYSDGEDAVIYALARLPGQP